MTVDEIFAGTTQNDLARNRYTAIFLKTNWRLGFIAIIEYDGHTGFRNTSLAALINEILEVLGSHGAHIRNTEDEANGIEDVGFSTTVETGDGIERFVPARKEVSVTDMITPRVSQCP